MFDPNNYRQELVPYVDNDAASLGNAGMVNMMLEIQKDSYDLCPCTACPNRAHCKIQCSAFTQYVNTGK